MILCLENDIMYSMRELENHINVLNAGISFGLVMFLGMLFLSFSSHFLNWGNEVLDLISNVYLGYSDKTILNAVAGAIWGFFDGFLGGVFIAFFYNLVSRIRR